MALLLLTVREQWFELPTVTYDVRTIYHPWFQTLSHGAFPNDHLWQYPPLAGLVVLLPGLLPFSYATSFYVISFIFDVVTFAVLLNACRRRDPALAGLPLRSVLRSGKQPWAAWIWAVGVAIGGPIAYGRYDLIVTSFVIWALVVLGKRGPERDAGKHGLLGGLFLGIGTMLKVWPGVLLLLIGPIRRTRTAWAAAAVTCAVILGGAWATMPHALHFLRNQQGRGVQIESVWALPFHLAINHGWHGRIDSGFGSDDFLGPYTRAVSLVAVLASVVAGLWLLLWRVTVKRWTPATPADAALVAILLFIVTSRVISPQYMIWLIGLAAVCGLQFGAEGVSVMRLPVILVLIATGLTWIEYPFDYDDVSSSAPGGLIVLTVRNVLLVAAAVIGGTRLWRSTRAAKPQSEAAATRHHFSRSRILATTDARFLILACTAAAVVSAHLRHGNPNGFFDLKIQRAAMLWWSHGHPLYDYAQADKIQGTIGLTYPPVAAILMRPLAWFSMRDAEVAHVLFAGTLAAFSLWLIVRQLAARWAMPVWFVFGMSALLASGLEPIRENFYYGQINPLIWALVLLDLLLLLPRNHRATGIGIGLATAVKLTPGFFIVYLLITRRFRAAVVAVATFVVVDLVALAVVPHTTWTFFSGKMWDTKSVGHMYFILNQSLFGVLARNAHSDHPSSALWLGIGVPLAVIGLWRARTAALRGDELVGLTIAGLTSCVISPLSWTHHIGWIVPALLVLVDVAFTARDMAHRTAALISAAIIYSTVTYSLILAWAAGHFHGIIGDVVARDWIWWVILALTLLLPVRTAVGATGTEPPVLQTVAAGGTPRRSPQRAFSASRSASRRTASDA